MLNPYALIAVILCHFLVFIPYERIKVTSSPPPKAKTEQKIKITLREQKLSKPTPPKVSSPSRLQKKNGLSFQKLGIGLGVQEEKHLVRKFSGNSGGTTTATLYNRINDGVIYPSDLSGPGISGHVSALIYIDSEGQYHEDKSRFKFSSRFLGVHVRLILRHTLQSKLRIKNLKAGHYPALFIFELTTGLENKKRRLLENGKMTFYRRSYGGDKGVDRLNVGITKTLAAVTNVFALLEYLPSVQEKKRRKRLSYLERLKEDSYWGK